MRLTPTALAALAMVAPSGALLRFGCSQLVIDRLDPLVNPGAAPSPHLHQIIGGNSFNTTMDPMKDMPAESTCTTCQPSEDFSNYWTAVLFYRARNGTYKRIPIVPNSGFERQKGGMTVYYMQNGLADFDQLSKVTAFKQGFRMITGSTSIKSRQEALRFRQLTYTCMQDLSTRFPESLDFPKTGCPAGIMANLRFPTCWDGVNLDSPDHMSHVSYPETGTFESQGPCPASHPVRIPQLMYETIWDTSAFNDKSDWPIDGTQPFIWSFGDALGYGTHGDYLFGWKGDALQKAMDTACYVNCNLKQQDFDKMNACTIPRKVNEDIDSWLHALPGQEMAMAS